MRYCSLKSVYRCVLCMMGLFKNIITLKELENVAIIAMYCHLRPPDAIAFPT